MTKAVIKQHKQQIECILVEHCKFQEKEVLEFEINCWALVKWWEGVCGLAATFVLGFQNETYVQVWPKTDGMGIHPPLPPARNINLNSYLLTKIPSQKPRIPGERF